MSPLVAVYLILLLISIPLAWRYGAGPERVGAVILLFGWLCGVVLSPLTLGRLSLGEALVDLAMTAATLHLALTGRRWWPLAAAAAMVLCLVVHALSILMPDLSVRGAAVARLGFGLLTALALMAGVAERRLAGEAAAWPGLSGRA